MTKEGKKCKIFLDFCALWHLFSRIHLAFRMVWSGLVNYRPAKSGYIGMFIKSDLTVVERLIFPNL